MSITKVLMLALVAFAFASCEKGGLDETIADNAALRGAEVDAQPIALYSFEGNVLTKIMDYPVDPALVSYQEDRSRHELMWKAARKMFPALVKNRIVQYEVHYTKGTFLVDTEPVFGNDEWKIKISIDKIADLADPNTDDAFLQEMIKGAADVLLTNSGQINTSINESDCSTWTTELGCIRPNSMLNDYVETFWQPIALQYETAIANNDIIGFYNDNRTSFVNRDAASGPLADVREIFSSFVISQTRPGNEIIVGEKIEHFYDNTLLFEIKTFMRARYEELLNQ